MLHPNKDNIQVCAEEVSWRLYVYKTVIQNYFMQDCMEDTLVSSLFYGKEKFSLLP